jgi:O-antigen ligase
MSNVELRLPPRGQFLSVTTIGLAFTLLVAAIVIGHGVKPAAGLLAVVSVVVVGARSHVRWDVVVAFVLVVVLVIPIKRYEFTIHLPFNLEPYRIVIGLVLAVWIAALLVDPRVRLRRSELDGPLLLVWLSATASIAFNPGWITRFNIIESFVGANWPNAVQNADQIPFEDVSTDVTKALLLFASFYVVFYFIVSVVHSQRAIESVVKTLVAGTAGVAVFALLERRTGYNVFNHLSGVIPLVNYVPGLSAADIARTGRLRVLASAQHPIALAALFAMVIPLSLYLGHQTKKRSWHLSSAVLFLGLLATVSRTGVVMLFVSAVVFYAILRPSIPRRLWLFAPLGLVVIHLVMPGAIGSLTSAFFPQGGLQADQTAGNGRISSTRLDPQLHMIEQDPVFGQGFGSRITTGPSQNSRILDNQWLATTVETGLLGAVAWLWLFVRFVRRAGREAKRDRAGRGWLLAALASSVAAFGVSMLTFDAFSFVQSTLVFFVLLALGSATLAFDGVWEDPARAVVVQAVEGRSSAGSAPASA